MHKVNKAFATALLCFIGAIHAAGIGIMFANGTEQTPVKAVDMNYYGGWGGTNLAQLKEADPHLLRDLPSVWKRQGKGKTRLLYRDYEAVHGHAYVPRAQGGAPSCVGQAAAAAVDILATVEIHSLGHPERAPPTRVAASAIYGLSRQEIGELGPLHLGGSHCLWACQALQKYGAVFHGNYGLIGYDLSEPSAAQCIKFGTNGLPASLEEIAKKHPVFEYVEVKTYEDLRDAVYAGSPVVIGSPVGFGNKSNQERDRDGFLSPPRRLFFPSIWRHAMVAIAVADEDRKGALILNSWGDDWIDGPKRFGDEPKGSFWVDEKVINRMLEAGDSFALRRFKGYPNYRVWK